MTDDAQEVKAKRDGKMYKCFLDTIEHIRAGETVLMFAPEYILMSRNYYDQICPPKEPPEPEDIIVYGEGGLLPKDFGKALRKIASLREGGGK